jgi:hypothetical protein
MLLTKQKIIWMLYLSDMNVPNPADSHKQSSSEPKDDNVGFQRYVPREPYSHRITNLSYDES